MILYGPLDKPFGILRGRKVGDLIRVIDHTDEKSIWEFQILGCGRYMGGKFNGFRSIAEVNPGLYRVDQIPWQNRK